MVTEVIQHPSPNFGPRRDGLRPSFIVVHYTAMENAAAALDRLCDTQAEVSAHYLISAKGQVTQMVAEDMRAWHAGQGEWAGLKDINSRSIGIELDNRGTHPFSEPQMSALETLLREIMDRWDISPAGVIGHSDMAPGRKTDPGPKFDWARLARQGLASLGQTAKGAPEARPDSYIAAARQAGFTADADVDTLLQATRLRFAPWRTGPLCAADLNLCHVLCSKWK